MTVHGGRRAFITGVRGQLGRELEATLPDGWLLADGSPSLDVTDPESLRRVVHMARPEVVLHAAAFTAVDRAEAEPGRAEEVNVRGAANVAEAAAEVGARLIYVSTDFVFDGTQSRPYNPSDAPAPLSVYGRTKLAGEREVARILGARALVVRTAWVYSRHGRNFVLTMLRHLRELEEVAVVSDQVGTPTWARSLAETLWAAATVPNLPAVLHWTDAGVASRYEFAVAIQEEALAVGLVSRCVPIRAIRSMEYPTPARRPAFSVLDTQDTSRALGREPSHWRVNLRHMLRELVDG